MFCCLVPQTFLLLTIICNIPIDEKFANINFLRSINNGDGYINRATTMDDQFKFYINVIKTIPNLF